MQSQVIIIGAGPAGLTAGYLLAKENIAVTILEADPHYVGGIARTVQYKGYCFDIGGHRFFSKAEEVENFWSEILPKDMLTRPRSSRIYYRGKFYSYPLNIIEVIKNLGLIESFCCLLSYLKACLFPIKQPKSFADWVSNHFGRRLFAIFFKTYTEKVWGMSCDDISADWASQRIQGLSFLSALKNACHLRKKSNNNKSVIKTLIDTFRYPRKGPGMLWEACALKIQELTGSLIMGCRVLTCAYSAERNLWTVSYQNTNGEITMCEAKHLISSAPLRDMVLNYLNPTLSSAALHAASRLTYRDFLIVVLILKDKKQFSDNWIYIHDPAVDVGRIQNFKSWSPDMVPHDDMCCYGLEYFCFENDTLWNQCDDVLIQKAIQEIVKIGLAAADDILEGCVVRQPKAYPVYSDDYKQYVDVIRQEIKQQFPTLHVVGRNGMHKYNNQDHAMMTAMLTVKNILLGQNDFDVWCVNQDAEYHESGQAGTLNLLTSLRQVPNKIK